MPHLAIEYSANLADTAAMGGLCAELARCLDAQWDGDKKVFPTGGIRVRAFKTEAYFIADGSIDDAAFIHLNLRIGAGRRDEVIEQTRTALMAVVTRWSADDYARRGLAISLEVNEFNRFGTLKHNNLHHLLAAQAAHKRSDDAR